MHNSEKKTIITSLVWKLLERTGTQGVQFIVQIVLARLLLPEDFGIVAIVSIFILLANVLVEGGFNVALIQKKDSDELDFTSSFYLSLFFALILYFLLYILSPMISLYYEMEILTNVLRILGISLFFGSVNSVQNALIAKNMLFKKQFLSTFASVIISGLIGIIFALNGFGVWSIVIQQLLTQVLTTIIYFKIVKWKPMLKFSISRIVILAKFGWKVLLSNILDTLFDDIRSLVIGKVSNASMLGYYNRGRQIPSVIVNNINGSIQAVMLPALSNKQDNLNTVKTMLRRSISTSSFIIFPLMFGIMASAESLIIVLLTEKWLLTVPFLQIFAMTYLFRPIQITNLQVIIALGRSDIALNLQIIKNIIGMVLLLLTFSQGVLAIAVAGMISTVLSTIINIYPNKRLVNYSYKEQAKDVLPSLILSILMFFVVYNLRGLLESVLLTLVIQIIVGIIIYIFLSFIFKLEELIYLKNTFLGLKKDSEVNKN